MTLPQVYSPDYFTRAERLRDVCRRLCELMATTADLPAQVQMPRREAFVVWADTAESGASAWPAEWQPLALRRSFAGLAGEFEGLGGRAGEPLRIAFMGAVKSGKSSTINGFLAHLFDCRVDELDPQIRRDAPLGPWDEKLTFLVHETQALASSEHIATVRISHPLFRLINLIDTPGLDEKPLYDLRVQQHLSHIDVIVYLFPANAAFHGFNVAFLKTKFSKFPTTPIVFVLTYAGTTLLHSVTHELDQTGTQIVIDGLNRDIQKGVPDYPGRNPLELAQGRRNTFVVDNKLSFGTAELFDALLAEYGSPAAGMRKLQVLASQVKTFAAEAELLIQHTQADLRRWTEFMGWYLAAYVEREGAILTERVRQAALEGGDALRRVLMRLTPRGEERGLLFRASTTWPERPSLAEVLPSDFSAALEEKLWRYLRALRARLDEERAAGVDEFRFSRVAFRAEIAKDRQEWIAVEEARIRADFKTPFTSPRMPSLEERCGAPHARQIVDSLANLLTRVAGSYGLHPDGVLGTVRDRLESGMARMETYCDSLRVGTVALVDDYRAALEQVLDPLPAEAARHGGALVDGLVGYVERRVVPPLTGLGQSVISSPVDRERLQELREELTTVGGALFQSRKAVLVASGRKRLAEWAGRIEERRECLKRWHHSQTEELRPVAASIETLCKQAAEGAAASARASEQGRSALLGEWYARRADQLRTELEQSDAELSVLVETSRERQRQARLGAEREFGTQLVEAERRMRSDLRRLEEERSRQILSLDRRSRAIWGRTVGAFVVAAVSIGVAAVWRGASEVGLWIARFGPFCVNVIPILAAYVYHVLQSANNERVATQTRAEVATQGIEDRAGGVRAHLEFRMRTTVAENESVEEQARRGARDAALREMQHRFSMFEEEVVTSMIATNAEVREEVIQAFILGRAQMEEHCERLVPVIRGVKRGIAEVYAQYVESIPGEAERALTEVAVEYVRNVDGLPDEWADLVSARAADRCEEIREQLLRGAARFEHLNTALTKKLEDAAAEVTLATRPLQQLAAEIASDEETTMRSPPPPAAAASGVSGAEFNR